MLPDTKIRKKTLPMKQYMLKMLIIKNGVRIAFPFQGQTGEMGEGGKRPGLIATGMVSDQSMSRFFNNFPDIEAGVAANFFYRGFEKPCH